MIALKNIGFSLATTIILLLLILNHTTVICDSKPVSMGSISPQEKYNLIAKSIVFLSEPQTIIEAGRFFPTGTGFLVSFDVQKKDGKPVENSSIVFLITNLHNVFDFNTQPPKLKHQIVYRINTADESASLTKTIDLYLAGKQQNVFFNNSSVDLVAIRFPDFEGIKPVIFDYSFVVSEQGLRKLEVDVGTEVFTVGVFNNFHGQKKNLPLFRFGRIAMLPVEPWWKTEKNPVPEKGFLAELNITESASGSPVLLFPTQVKVMDSNIKYRSLDPLIVGVVKGKEQTIGNVITSDGKSIQKSPNLAAQSQLGLAVIEYSYELRNLLDELEKVLKRHDIEIDKHINVELD